MARIPSTALAALTALVVGGGAALAAEPADPVLASGDPVLEGLVREALDRSPEYARARATVAAERERIPQAGALADPTLSLGIQNDGFKEIQIGKMETSYFQIMVTQPLPWPGKRGARERAARAQASAVEAQLERVRLTTTAEVERAYVDLLLVRGQLALLGKLEALWKEAEAMARTRYAVGEGAQSDLVRSQLERTRLAQQRVALEAAEQTRVETLNRLRAHPLDEPIATSRTLAEVARGAPLAAASADAAIEDAEARSPELAQARLATEAAERRVEAARRESYPDLSVTAGVMPRGGLEPMWLASVGFTLPIFHERKGARAIAESGSRRDAEAAGVEATRQVVALRARQRHAVASALARTNDIYAAALLVQSDAAVRSTLSQYKVGRVTFASVLDVLRGLVADEGGYLESLAQAERVAIAAREVSLDAPAGAGGGTSSGSVPGAGATGGGGGAKGGAAGGAPEQAAPSSGGAMGSGM
jgi:outer membrane protein, heavy metal efflux system